MGTDLSFFDRKCGTEFDISPLSEEEWNDLKLNVYKLPQYKDVVNEMWKIHYGGTIINTITDFYFRNLMNDCIRHSAVYSVNEVMNTNLLCAYVKYIVSDRRKSFFMSNSDDIYHAFKTYFAMAGSGLGASVGQFPLETIQYLLDTYNVNNKYYDFSCGWGCRLTGALSHNIDYYGTDPNYLLVDKLNAYIKDWKKEIPTTSDAKIYCQGSEFFIPELENKVGLCFSSTPYFALEDYRHGNQSCKKDSYDAWRDDYLEPTIQNCYKYLIDDGYFIINVKNYKKFPIEEDSVRLAEKNGFTYIKTEDLYLNKNFSRPIGKSGERITTTEPMFVFKKGNPKIKSKVDLW